MTGRFGKWLLTAALSSVLPACAQSRHAARVEPRTPPAQASSSALAPAPVQPAPPAEHAEAPTAPVTAPSPEIVPVHNADLPADKPTVAKIAVAATEDQEPEIAPAAATSKPAEAVPREPLVDALQCFLDKRPEEAVALLGKYEKTNQDLFLCLLPLAARLTEVNVSQLGDHETAMILDQMNSLAQPLRPRAALTIDKLCFCRRVYGFGAYEPLPDGHSFKPGDDVHVYVELRNFSSEKKELAPGQVAYVTQVVCAAEIYDGTGKVWRRDQLVFRRERPDESRSLRHDYFDHCQFYMPNIPPGRYTLQLRATDVPTRRTVKSAPLPFRVSDLAVRGS